MLFEKEAVKERWVQYFEGIDNKNNIPNDNTCAVSLRICLDKSQFLTSGNVSDLRMLVTATSFKPVND